MMMMTIDYAFDKKKQCTPQWICPIVVSGEPPKNPAKLLPPPENMPKNTENIHRSY